MNKGKYTKIATYALCYGASVHTASKVSTLNKRKVKKLKGLLV